MSDSELLYDVNLQQLPAEYLQATWRVVDQRAGKDPEADWSDATHLELGSHALHLQGKTIPSLTGSWTIERSSLLGQPYLALELPHSNTQALITRFRRSSDGRRRLLKLYFRSGLELELTHP
ncbi:hypothetical protein [Hymenobacter persicinus]|uniref:Uncharacterized protein n=1 Tax=Hymenobacter persicinus TaxID=2025506 RepID=A0A4Q5LJP1_9BACT|nr:hypothetical protein [Hymenobacter persicinus]RYU84242.1 hypothetical protein EWM57_00680 [Hymenobacter persicinus]